MFKNYRLFAKPVYDVRSEKILMHELVIEEMQDSENSIQKDDDSMQDFFEDNYSEFINWMQKELLKILTNQVYTKVAINIRSSQFFYAETMKMFEKLRIFNDRVIIEVTEDLVQLPAEKSHFTPTELDAFLFGKIRTLQAFGYDVMLDDVGCGINSLERTVYYLPLLKGFKISLDAFELPVFDAFIAAWKSFADQHKKMMVLENVRDELDSAVLKKMGINLQQGCWLDELINKKVS
ncbi:diguanylate phosphodiesterase [Listeria floridensis FSL S10-1187]|uniref:Diguanylate phosphodiesterase n=1 Tax=Listeria floridensis FSL S10-1187 TaxID=1265817 RepID=A0ABP3B1L4_9LIST|nr:EAL domain-containing protein [Listeria floridensis]EUJ33815.1 diguanylate phosphodiesterase [Listeria floridensis FSL S10-1187]